MDGQELLKGLNDRQTEAVTHREGPLLILAGAGSGKTRVITHRTGYLIANGVAPWNILAITFTNKAAAEMRERVDRLIGDGASRIWVSTFHSMCVRLLRRDIDKLGYAGDFVIYDADDQRTLVKRCIKKLNLDTRIYRERGLLSLISKQKNSFIGAAEFAEQADDFYDRNAANVYLEYEKELKSNNALDFDDLLVKTAQLFKDFPEVLEYWQERFRYIMVDEYQDTNTVQFEIVRLLALKYRNLCVVGDDDQSIYKFRGANIENILDFENTFPGAKVIKLEQNYRSTGSILNAANAVISNNNGRKEKKLWTDNNTGELPVYNEYDTASGEAEAVISCALSAAVHGTPLKEQAILYRTNAQSRLLEEKCIAKGVPYIIVGGINFYQRREIKDMLSYLRTIANPSDDLSSIRIVNVPKRGIGQASVDKVSAMASARDISFYEALCRADEVPGIGTLAAKRIKGFTDFMEHIRDGLRNGEYTLKSLTEYILNESGYGDELVKEDPVSAETRIENIRELINKEVSFEEEYCQKQDADGGDTGSMAMLSVFLEDISLVADIDRTSNTDNVLTMMTLHSAKGLEFDTVYLVGMEEGLFPSAAAIHADNPEEEIEEERRLCYVGITRARRVLHMSSARERMVNGETHGMAVSRFIDEIPDSMADKHYRSKRGADRGRSAFSGFGGYEGSLERGQGYGFDSRFGGGYGGSYASGSSCGSGSGYSNEERAYGAYNAYDSTAVTGRYGSLDTSRTGKAGGRSPGSRNTGGKEPDGSTTGGGSYGKGRGASGRSKGTSLRSASGLVRGFNSAADNRPIKRLPDYNVGDRVGHTKFGNGVVTALTEDVKDYRVTVDFDEAGTKVMYAGFAKLKKL